MVGTKNVPTLQTGRHRARFVHTVNPRPFDLYNIETEPDEMAMVFEGFPLQPQLDYVLTLGAFAPSREIHEISGLK
jgi:hypothetical protein